MKILILIFFFEMKKSKITRGHNFTLVKKQSRWDVSLHGYLLKAYCLGGDFLLTKTLQLNKSQFNVTASGKCNNKTNLHTDTFNYCQALIHFGWTYRHFNIHFVNSRCAIVTTSERKHNVHSDNKPFAHSTINVVSPCSTCESTTRPYYIHYS